MGMSLMRVAGQGNRKIAFSCVAATGRITKTYLLDSKML